jgi:hypothetical protein
MHKKMIRAHETTISAWAFMLGVILAVIVGITASSLLSIESVKSYSAPIYAGLVVFGLVVGFLIKGSAKESENFLVAGTVLVIISYFGKESVTGSLIGIGISDTVSSTFSALLALFVPATIVVALKRVFSLARV